VVQGQHAGPREYLGLFVLDEGAQSGGPLLLEVPKAVVSQARAAPGGGKTGNEITKGKVHPVLLVTPFHSEFLEPGLRDLEDKALYEDLPRRPIDELTQQPAHARELLGVGGMIINQQLG